MYKPSVIFHRTSWMYYLDLKGHTMISVCVMEHCHRFEVVFFPLEYFRFCMALQTEGCKLSDLPDDIDRNHLQLLYDNATCTHDIILLVQCCISLFLCLLVIIMNSTMIVTLIKNKHLHNTTNWLLLSLACSDFLFGLSSIYTPVMTLLTTSAAMSLNDALVEEYISIRSTEVLCLLLDETGFGFATMTASLLSLVALAIEKYIAVFHPFEYHQYMKPCTVVLTALAIWLVSILFGALPLLGWNEFTGVCAFVQRTSFSYVITWSTICMTGAVLVFYVYMRIFFIARKHARQIRQTLQYIATASISMADQTTVNPKSENIVIGRIPPIPPRRFTVSIPNSPIRAVKTVAIVLGVFYMCWLPLLIYFLAFPNHYSNLVIKFLIMVALCNSLCNPFIYGIRNRAIREAIVCCLWGPTSQCPKTMDDVQL